MRSGWQGRVFDLKSAYRQCAISPASIPFSYIGVFDPKAKKVKAFRLVALPFGSIAAVHAFLRLQPVYGSWDLKYSMCCGPTTSMISLGMPTTRIKVCFKFHPLSIQSFGLRRPCEPC